MAEVNTWSCDVCGAIKKPTDKYWWRGSIAIESKRIVLTSFNTMRSVDEKTVSHLCGIECSQKWIAGKASEITQ